MLSNDEMVEAIEQLRAVIAAVEAEEVECSAEQLAHLHGSVAALDALLAPTR